MKNIKIYTFIKQFTKAKKTQKKQLQISFREHYNQQFKGFILYNSLSYPTIRNTNIMYILMLSTSMIIFLSNPYPLRINYGIMLSILGITWFLYQRRISKTLKRLVLDERGQLVRIYTYNKFGLSENCVEGQVLLLQGIFKGTIFGGNVIRGGGIYDYEKKNYWFDQKYIIQEHREIFQTITAGGNIKILP